MRAWHTGTAAFVSMDGGTPVTIAADLMTFADKIFTIGRADRASDVFLSGRVQALGLWSRNLTAPEIAFLSSQARLYAALPG